MGSSRKSKLSRKSLEVAAQAWSREARVWGGAPLGTKSRSSSGCVEGDLVAEGVQLADEETGLAVLVDALAVVGGA